MSLRAFGFDPHPSSHGSEKLRRGRSNFSLLLLAGVLMGCAPGGSESEAGAGGSGELQEGRIIVSGASGQLGGLVVEKLLALGIAPQNLILVSRTPEELSEYAAMGASTRFGDFLEPESLTTAYEGGDRMLLISVNAMGPQRQRMHATAIDAAVAAGVSHIAYTSFVDLENNNSALAADHRATEEHLRESGVAWTMLRNGLYMDGLPQQAAQIVSAGRVAVPGNELGIAYVTREDCAAVAAAVLAFAGHEGRAYDITGSEVIGERALAQIIGEITGTPIEIVQGSIPAEAAPANPSFIVVSTAVADVTGHPPITARELLTERRAEWEGGI
jgi:NAD(P)H dehydrogenase (quinone)